MQLKVNQRALFDRVNRRLAKEGRKLSRPKSQSERDVMGDFYIFDIQNSIVETTHVDLLTLGKELGAIKDYEEYTG